MSGTVTEHHRALAQDALCPGSKYCTPEEARMVERIVSAIADAEHRGFVQGVRAAAELYACPNHEACAQRDNRRRILALLPPDEVAT